MDESGDGQAARRTRSKAKYINLLQDVADRKVDHIVIDLDDLDQVIIFKTPRTFMVC